MQIFRTGKLTDKQVVRLLEDFIGQFGASTAPMSVSGLGVIFSEELKQSFKGKDVGAITSFDVTSDDKKLTLRFRRGVGGDASNLDVGRQPSPYFDEVALDFPSRTNSSHPTPTAEELIAAVTLVKKHIVFVIPDSVETGAQSATAVLQAQLSALNDRLLEINKQADERRQQVENEHLQRMAELEVQAREAEASIAARRAELELEIGSRVEELDRRAKHLDDRDHMHVRRELRERIISDIQDRLGRAMVGRTSGVMRWSVLVLSLLGSTVFSWFAYVSLVEYADVVATGITAETPLLVEASTWVLLGEVVPEIWTGC